MQFRIAIGLAVPCLAACASLEYPVSRHGEVATRVATVAPDPEPARLAHLDASQVARGHYLAQIMGCGGCHTDGALVGAPDAARLFAGSSVGIAATDPARDLRPAVVFPANLTPDPKTGIGGRSDAQIAAAIRAGWHGEGAGELQIMPWREYAILTNEDVAAIVAYLRSIPAIEHPVPGRVARGTNAHAPYLYFGVYRSGPAVSAGR